MEKMKKHYEKMCEKFHYDPGNIITKHVFRDANQSPRYKAEYYRNSKRYKKRKTILAKGEK